MEFMFIILGAVGGAGCISSLAVGFFEGMGWGERIRWSILVILFGGLAIYGAIKLHQSYAVFREKEAICESIGGRYTDDKCFKEGKEVDLDEEREN